MFELQQVSRIFSQGEPALDRVSLTVKAGEVLAVLGPSGAGKSTLLRLLNALDEPTSGTVLCEGRPLAEWDVQALRRHVSMLFQVPTMFGGTVRDNLLTPLRLRGAGELEADWCDRLLRSVGLDPELLEREAATLSVGQQQRVAFARALVLKPAAILLDEPTASLDPATSSLFLEHLTRLSRELGLTVVLVTHQVEHARAVADRIALLVAGSLSAIDTTQGFFQSDNPTARRYLAGISEAPA